MKTSESIKNLAPALLTAQKKITSVSKDADNPYFNSTYADLPAVIEATKGAFNDAGIVVLQPPFNRDGKNFIETILVHAASGEWASSETEVKTTKDDAQSFGAGQTYARRFGLQSFALLPAEDDDGNKASGRDVPAAKSTPKPTPKTPVAAKTATVSPAPATPAATKPVETPTAAVTASPTTPATPKGVRASTFKNKANGAAPAEPAATPDPWAN